MDGYLPVGEKPLCILVLQGGGALGAYHIGACEALQERGFAPDWVCGISIGAINAAVIAGNPPAMRIAQLDGLWRAISWPEPVAPPEVPELRLWANHLSNAQALAFGQPAFFTPRLLNPYLAPPGPSATSFYDTAPLHETLRHFADFDWINGPGGMRLTVGATNVETGRLAFFDNRRLGGRFGAEHVVASGSLPPGFPATPIGDRIYWDGGCVSNTPLEAVLRDPPGRRAVAFVIDLWNPNGPRPTTMEGVLARAKQIQYASRTAHHVDSVATKLNLRRAMHCLNHPGAAPSPQLDIVHIIYRPDADEIAASDAEFSRHSIAVRRSAGYDDMRRALSAAPWALSPPGDHVACQVHRVTRDGITTVEPELDRTTDRPPAATSA